MSTWTRAAGPWLKGQRGKRKQDEIVDQLRKEQGVEISRAWLSRIEHGARFSDELLAAFERLYGSAPPEMEEAPPASDGSEGLLPVLERIATALESMIARPPEGPPDWLERAEAVRDELRIQTASPPPDTSDEAGSPESRTPSAASRADPSE